MAEGVDKSVDLLYRIVDSSSARKLITKSLARCEKCRARRINVILDLLYGDRKAACFKCKLYAKFIKKILTAGAKAFGASGRKMEETFSKPYWRRGLSAVLAGIARFGVRKPFVPGAPFQIVWDITYKCNLKCKHCYASAGEKKVNESSTEEVKKGIDKLADGGVVILAFSGGEPLVRKDILELTRYAADYGMYVALATNGTLITQKKAKEIKGNGVEYLQISLDGSSGKTHDEFRGVPGMFARTLEGIRNAVAQDFFVNISTTATAYNYKEIPEIISLCEELGVDWFMAYNFIPTGRGKFIQENDLAPAEREKLLRVLWEKLKTSKINVLSTAPQFARVAIQCESELVPTHFSNLELRGRLSRLAEFIGGCGAGRSYLAIEPDGKIQPCVFFPLTLGNIMEDDFEDLWVNNHILQELRNKDLLEDNCGSCNYRDYCGGCRARAYGYFGDYLKPDPGCINNREAYNSLNSLRLS